MRISVVGPVALNAYLLARCLRRLGVDADSYDFGGGNPMWTPWWEECANLDETALAPNHYDWTSVAAQTGFRRPPWAKILGTDLAAPWYDTQEAFEADLKRFMPALGADPESRTLSPEDAELLLGHRPEAEARTIAEALPRLPSWRSIRAIAARSDLTVLCGPTAGYGALLPEGTPYVAFEHATMRYVHRLVTPSDRLLALAYRKAAACVITNADCHEAAECLGLENYRFLPHPLDEERFCPGPSTYGDAVRARLGVDLLLYAPARHSMNESAGTKSNERIVYAFARYLREAVPAGSPTAALILAAWGQHVAETKRIIKALGIEPHVYWTECLPKPKALEWYRAADIVLDQFSETVGSFGTVTAEALACGKPVVTHLDPAVHEWCLPVLGELPPVWNALRTGDIYRALRSLANSPGLRSLHGTQGREWVERRHGWRQTAERHLALYREVLDKGRAQGPSEPAAWEMAWTGTVPTPRETVWTDAGAIGLGRTVPVAAAG